MSAWPPTYDYAAAVTPSDTAISPTNRGDAAGPFAGLYCTSAGPVVVYLYGNPKAGPITVNLVGGSVFPVPVLQIGITGTVGSVVGLIAANIRQGS